MTEASEKIKIVVELNIEEAAAARMMFEVALKSLGRSAVHAFAVLDAKFEAACLQAAAAPTNS